MKAHSIVALLAALVGIALVGGLAAAGDRAGRPAAPAAAKKKVKLVRGARGKTGPRGFSGAKGLPGAAGPAGAPGPQGAPGSAASDVARSLTLNWRDSHPAGRDTATTTLPGLVALRATCNPSTQVVHLDPLAGGATRTVLSLQTFFSATAQAQRITLPADVPLPNNGMLTGTVSVEPVDGDGGPGPAPATLVLSSEFKVNADPGNPADTNSCFVAGQLLRQG